MNGILGGMAANAARFTFSVKSLGELGVYSFKGHEQINRPFRFEIEIVSRNSSLNYADSLGAEALLTITDISGVERFVHGLIMQAEQLHTSDVFTHYKFVLVPRLWFLSKRQNHKIFQNKTAPEIIEEILAEHRFPVESVKFDLGAKYPKREYSTQYAESDLHYLTRLCEECAIFFYVSHTEDGHCLCFADYPSGLPKIPGEQAVRFYPGSGQVASTPVISRWNAGQQVESDAAALREWNFTNPGLAQSLELSQKGMESEVYPATSGMNLELYQFPHLYQQRDDGKRYVDIEHRRQLAFRRWALAESDVARFTPGHTFSMYEHDRASENRGWLVHSVAHEGEQPGVLEHVAPDSRGHHYKSKVTALPDDIWYVAPFDHPKKRVDGLQSAVVTGPEGEEIYTDKFGRVKVQFHWDRLGQKDENTTCWVRVAQGWAGSGYGAISIPRIGHEVLVEYMEGDPDRPVITGRVFNGYNYTPYKLPENKTQTVIYKSMSTPGEDEVPRGFNELRIEDKAGEEEIYQHAQKDVNTLTENDWKDVINNDRHQTVKKNTYVKTGGETHETLGGVRKAELHDNDHLTVHGSSHTEVKQKWLVKSGDEIHLKAGNKTVIEAGTELTLKAGNAWIKLTPAGLKMSGRVVKVNEGGSPANGSGANPLLPTGAKPVEKSLAPVDMACACRQAVGMPFVEIA